MDMKLPVVYNVKKKGWITLTVFTEYFSREL
jgi:hypothetical protein